MNEDAQGQGVVATMQGGLQPVETPQLTLAPSARRSAQPQQGSARDPVSEPPRSDHPGQIRHQRAQLHRSSSSLGPCRSSNLITMARCPGSGPMLLSARLSWNTRVSSLEQADISLCYVDRRALDAQGVPIRDQGAMSPESEQTEVTASQNASLAPSDVC